MKRRGFTLVELIFVIVIIGVLSAVAVPKFTNLLDNAKITSEISTAASVQASLDAIHAEWVTNRCEFVWSENPDDNVTTADTAYFDDDVGYPKMLEKTGEAPLSLVINKPKDWEKVPGFDFRYIGPASKEIGERDEAESKNQGKPDGNDYWEYSPTTGGFNLVDVN